MAKKQKSLRSGHCLVLSGDSVEWKVHTANLLTEIVDCSGQAILQKPIHIFGRLLADVGERAAELNDPKLNALMRMSGKTQVL